MVLKFPLFFSIVLKFENNNTLRVEISRIEGTEKPNINPKVLLKISTSK